MPTQPLDPAPYDKWKVAFTMKAPFYTALLDDSVIKSVRRRKTGGGKKLWLLGGGRIL